MPGIPIPDSVGVKKNNIPRLTEEGGFGGPATYVPCMTVSSLSMRTVSYGGWLFFSVLVCSQKGYIMPLINALRVHCVRHCGSLVAKPTLLIHHRDVVGHIIIGTVRISHCFVVITNAAKNNRRRTLYAAVYNYTPVRGPGIPGI